MSPSSFIEAWEWHYPKTPVVELLKEHFIKVFKNG